MKCPLCGSENTEEKNLSLERENHLDIWGAMTANADGTIGVLF